SVFTSCLSIFGKPISGAAGGASWGRNDFGIATSGAAGGAAWPRSAGSIRSRVEFGADALPLFGERSDLVGGGAAFRRELAHARAVARDVGLGGEPVEARDRSLGRLDLALERGGPLLHLPLRALFGLVDGRLRHLRLRRLGRGPRGLGRGLLLLLERRSVALPAAQEVPHARLALAGRDLDHAGRQRVDEQAVLAPQEERAVLIRERVRPDLT